MTDPDNSTPPQEEKTGSILPLIFIPLGIAALMLFLALHV
jgi:hypothetical protein